MHSLTDFTMPTRGTLLDAVAKIQANHARSVLVMRDDVVEGVISEGDVMRALLRGVDIHAPIESFVHHDFKFLRSRDFAGALALARRYGITLFPIVDDAFHLVDVLTLQDLLDEVQLRVGP